MRQDTDLHMNYGVSKRSSAAAKTVVIVDDSRTMRRWLRQVLSVDNRLRVVGEASNAQAARAIIKETRPDVVTLDIEMPGMNGLEFLDRLMRLRPMPVVMVSSATRRGSEAAVRALSLGAVDCILKPSRMSDPDLQRDLGRRVYGAACSTVSTRYSVPASVDHGAAMKLAKSMPIVLIGASTGGVTALETVLHGLHPEGPPVVIVQHMPGTFLASFSQMLDRKFAQSVGLLRDNEALGPGQVMLAPAIGETHAQVYRKSGLWHSRLCAATERSLHYPSVNALFQSAVQEAKDVFAVLLTGMGRDGALGLKALRAQGARTLAQDEASSVAYGMPGAAMTLGAVEKQLPPEEIAETLNLWAQEHARACQKGRA